MKKAGDLKKKAEQLKDSDKGQAIIDKTQEKASKAGDYAHKGHVISDNAQVIASKVSDYAHMAERFCPNSELKAKIGMVGKVADNVAGISSGISKATGLLDKKKK